MNKYLFFSDNNAFQLCLPIIRCLLSALIVQWENFRGEDRSKNYLKQLTLSTNLIILLKKVIFYFLVCFFFFVLYLIILGSLSSNTIK
jgi:hypothetical protein